MEHCGRPFNAILCRDTFHQAEVYCLKSAYSSVPRSNLIIKQLRRQQGSFGDFCYLLADFVKRCPKEVENSGIM